MLFWQVKLYQHKHAQMKTNTSRRANYTHVRAHSPALLASLCDDPVVLPEHSRSDGVRFDKHAAIFHAHYSAGEVTNGAGDTSLVSLGPCGPLPSPNPAPLILLIAWPRPALSIGPPSRRCHGKLMRTK